MGEPHTNAAESHAAPPRPLLTRLVLGCISLAVATAIWLPCLRLFYKPDLADYVSPDRVSPKAAALARRHLDLWTDPDLRRAEIERMRVSNAEWDFMARTFLVLSLANMAIREPDRAPGFLEQMDTIIDETIRLDRTEGNYFFLMDYARNSRFMDPAERSLFVDGEIALMLAARQLIEPRSEYLPLLDDRIETVIASMRRGPVLCAESYPNECWMFCNTTALAAATLADAVENRNRAGFAQEWLDTARAELVDQTTGLLVSSFTYDGQRIDGPEGSSIWWTAHCLQLVDEQFARDQYRRARSELGRTILGFGFAREWPVDCPGPADVDSGPIVPIVEASAGSSGQALIAAAAFGDDAFLAALIASLNFAGFPVERGNALRYCASNQVGDAVLLYSMVQGPLWRRAQERLNR
jgi:hypothetical protein